MLWRVPWRSIGAEGRIEADRATGRDLSEYVIQRRTGTGAQREYDDADELHQTAHPVINRHQVAPPSEPRGSQPRHSPSILPTPLPPCRPLARRRLQTDLPRTMDHRPLASPYAV